VTPLSVKDYLITHKGVTRIQISHHFGFDESLVDVILRFWMKLGKVTRKSQCFTCAIGCEELGLYQWVG